MTNLFSSCLTIYTVPTTTHVFDIPKPQQFLTEEGVIFLFLAPPLYNLFFPIMSVIWPCLELSDQNRCLKFNSHTLHAACTQSAFLSGTICSVCVCGNKAFSLIPFKTFYVSILLWPSWWKRVVCRVKTCTADGLYMMVIMHTTCTVSPCQCRRVWYQNFLLQNMMVIDLNSDHFSGLGISLYWYIDITSG